MKKGLLLGLFALLFCLKSFSQTTIVDSFKSDGIWRSYRLYIPANYSSANARPLILNMHGLGSNAFEQQYYSNFMPIADTAGFLMAYPQGLTTTVATVTSTYWNVGIPLTPNTNDVKFLSTLIDTISNRYSVDKNRVYATGMSLGGYMSHYLALNLSNRIAAIASVTGTIYQGVYATANPGRAVPMMQIHGTADSTVPYNGSATGIPIDTLVKFWVNNNRCNPTPVHTSIPNINTADMSTATHDVYTGGTNGATCEFYKIEGGEHTWPGSPIPIGITNQDFSASTEIWRFFRSFQLNQFVGIETIPERSLNGFYPNPCHDEIYIKGDVKGNVLIRDFAGRTVVNIAGQKLSTATLAPGLYLIEYTSNGKRYTGKLQKQ